MKKRNVIRSILAVIFTFLIAAETLFVSFSIDNTITGETSRTVEEITLSDGTHTGVSFTQASLSGHYGNGKVVSAAEFDLSDTHLSVEVFNCGSNTVGLQTVANGLKKLNGNGKTVLAAVNGDLWMTAASSTSAITKSTLRATRGALIIDREIWATNEIEQEVGIGGGKQSFGVTSKNQPLVGIMDIAVCVKNVTRNVSLDADGINRLPANNAVIVYNNRLNNTNYALNDSYEIEINCTSSRFVMGENVIGTVKAVYPSGSTARPSIGDNTVVLTVRGNRISEASSTFAVGDKVSISTSITDRYGNTELWNDVTDAISGHMMPLKGSEPQPFQDSSSEYPITLIGVKKDGKVMFCTVSYQSSGVYKGLRINQSIEFCREMGYSDVFYLDGGGSATMVTLKEGTYTVRNCTSDGSPRSVVNGVALVWNTEPVCEKQGDMGHLVEYPLTFDTQNAVNERFDSLHSITCEYDGTEKAAKLTVTEKFNPYLRIDVSDYMIKTNQFPYAVVTYKVPSEAVYKMGQIFVTTSDGAVRETRIVSSDLKSAEDGSVWISSVLDLSANAFIMEDGVYIEKVRIDPFYEGNVGVEFFLDSVCFCRSTASADAYARARLKERNGAAPSGTQLYLYGSQPVASSAYAQLDRISGYGYSDFTASFDMAFFDDTAIGCYYLCDGEKYIYVSKKEIGLGDTLALAKRNPVLTHVTPIDWGEASPLNVHRVTVRVRNGDASVYLDGIKKALINGENLFGNGVSATEGKQKLGTCDTASVLFDNFSLYNSSGQRIYNVFDFSVKSTGTLCTVSYSSNAGAGFIPKNIFVKGNRQSISSASPVLPGYTFIGWSENVSASDPQYLSSSFYSGEGSPVLYAVYKAPHSHSWNEGVVTEEAGCDKEGIMTYSCSGCDEKYTETIPAKGHSFDEGTVVLEPTCTVAGILIKRCTVCNEGKPEQIPALGHSWGEGIVIEAPTPVSTGIERHYCSRCSQFYNVILPELDYLPGDVDGDGEVSLKDSKQMKKYLAGIVNEDEIVFANADIDGDGEISLKDSKSLKLLIANY